MEDEALSTPLSLRTGPALVLTRTRSQEAVYASAAPPFAQYPPDMAVQQLRHQVGQAVDAQASRSDTVQQAVGAQGQRTYEQLMALHQQQQMQANAQMELNQRLMAELALQRDQQNQLMAQLEAQRRTTENHDQGLRAAATSSILQAEALEDMRRRTSARWHAFTATPAPQTVQAPATVGVHIVYGFQEVPKAPTFNGSTKVQKRRFMDQYEAYMREIRLANAQRPGGQQIRQMPLSGCIDPLAVERIAFWEIEAEP
ncbi:hypothetical protein H310_07043 [Aphanomyces invadans]|uniref:Uncharacterized protein n=1 Tax=Aphanomyces invadans TaxID=157072 RepID=A0A024U2G1_9STRA|nr:hypothetical protein H310_07043 [Aphanomyces invadans]ETW00404.1 hypothetical protein H310_07043 [Aphanomyces invadans]|eukprot:XP_008870539.1 hypothetical protein H310_07043 [Aphanomyces invadans]